jgi:hypothetical protein
MSGEIVNLRQARKHRAAALAESRAAANRAKFGIPKSAKRALAAERELVDRRLDGLRRPEPGDDG